MELPFFLITAHNDIEIGHFTDFSFTFAENLRNDGF